MVQNITHKLQSNCMIFWCWINIFFHPVCKMFKQLLFFFATSDKLSSNATCIEDKRVIWDCIARRINPLSCYFTVLCTLLVGISLILTRGNSITLEMHILHLYIYLHLSIHTHNTTFFHTKEEKKTDSMEWRYEKLKRLNTENPPTFIVHISLQAKHYTLWTLAKKPAYKKVPNERIKRKH